ncbi:MAG: trehalose-phosphatase [Acidobacteriota bacterium]
MHYLLSRASRTILTRLAHEEVLCAFDFDGTLSPIVDRPEQAGMRVRTRRLLIRLAALYPCIVVSGRARADVLSKLGAVKVARVIGNHGAETEAATCSSRRMVARWTAALERELGAIPGLWMEDKGVSMAVHYRQSPHKTQVLRHVLAAAGKLPGVRVLGGKRVVNLVADGAPHKGDAVAAERTRLGCQWILYVGDDDNDEDAFALAGQMVPVRIGRKQRSHARYYLHSQAEIDDLLDLLVRLRAVAGRGTAPRSYTP